MTTVVSAPRKSRADSAQDVQSLVLAAKAADPDAWEALYGRTYPRLLAYASRHLDGDQAGDAAAETIARAFASIDRFEWTGSGWDGWLFGILRHVVLDQHRLRSRQSRPHGTERALEPEPLERVLADEETTALRAAFAQLNPAERELLDLRIVAGLSSEEVAATLGKRPGAVRMAQARAIERLRRNLNERA